MAAQYPGYTGHISKQIEPVLQLKTGVSSRSSLTDRIKPTQAIKESTEPEPIRCYFLPKRHVGTTSYAECTSTYVKSSSDVPPRRKEPKPAVEHIPTQFEARTCLQVSQQSVASPPPANFFSTVRKIEKSDDDNRGSLVVAPTRSGAALNLRNVDIMRKRETDSSLAPPKIQFSPFVRREKNGVPPPTASETVHFTHISPLTSNQLEFANPTLLAQQTLTKAHNSLRRALSETASTGDMFSGTAKSREELIPCYMGHVPAHPKNLLRLKGDGDSLRQHSKCAINVCVGKAAKHRNRPRSDASRSQTVMGLMLEEAATDAVERRMNRVEHGRKKIPDNF